MTRVLLTLLILVAALSSCRPTTSSTSSTTGPVGATGKPVYDERQACTADGDCIAVEIGCCDHCNGGQVVGIHRDYAAEVHKTYASADKCGTTMCTKMACAEPPAPFCHDGVCGVRQGDREDVPALPPER